MNTIKILLSTLLACAALSALQAQEIAGMRARLASGRERVAIIEQSDAAEAIRAVEQRTKRTKVNGYTILILSDNSQKARENAEKAKQTFEENFPDIDVKMYYESPSFYVAAGRYLTKEEAIIELWRVRSVFPKAISQSREMDIDEFIIRPDEQGDTSAVAKQPAPTNTTDKR